MTLQEITALARAGFSKKEILSLATKTDLSIIPAAPAAAPVAPAAPAVAPAAPAAPAAAAPAPAPAAPAAAPAAAPVGSVYENVSSFTELIQQLAADLSKADLPPKDQLQENLDNHFMELLGGVKPDNV